MRMAAPVATKEEATPEGIINSLKEIISPYELDVTQVDWCGLFSTRRRIASSPSKYSRIFLVGDALHVHSPRAGIGMNFSIQDGKYSPRVLCGSLLTLSAYNLGWKIVHVIKGISPLALLKTYDEERGLTSKQLLAFDKAISKQSPMGAKFSVEGTSGGLKDNLPFSSTTAIEYEAGLLVAKEGASFVSKQHLAPDISVGRRLPSQTVERHMNGEPISFGKCFPSDGKYRIVVFADNISEPEQLRRVENISKVLNLSEGLVQRLDSRGITPQDVFDILIVHSASRDDVEVTDLPPLLLKNSDPFDHVFVDNNQSRTWALTDAHAKYGINQERGCIVLVRPDRHVTYIGELEDIFELVQLASSIYVN